MNTPYRIPTPPAMPKTKHEWIVLWSKDSSDPVNLFAYTLNITIALIGLTFIFTGLCSEVQRALLVWGVFLIAWCLAYVRRKPITETNT